MRTLVSRPRMALAILCAAVSAAAGQDTRPTAALPKAPPSRPAIDVPTIRYTDFTLPNGLRVILHEDHSSPIVAFELWYNVGSKDERTGKTGISHLFEHMMFGQSVNLPDGEMRRIVQAAGGNASATAQNDWTRYYMTLPSNYLEMGVWLNAENMANFAQAVDEKRFSLERDAVFNEYRDRILNSALQSAAEAMFEAMYPNGGVYSSPLFGYHADLKAMTTADMRQWYETYYVPNNAVLVIAGDLTAADARRKVEKHFSPIPRGKPVPKPPALTSLRGETRLLVEHPSGVRQVWFAWRGPQSNAVDRPTVLALSSIMTERLRRLLFEERRLINAPNPVANTAFDLKNSGIIQVALTPLANASATDIERLADSVFTDIRNNGVTVAEVQRWVNAYRLQTLASMQTVQMKADYLADGAINSNNPRILFDIVERAQRVTPEAVQAAAKKYLTANRVILSVVPTGKPELMARPDLPYTNATRKGGS